MKILSQNEIQMVSGGDVDWWRSGFDVTAFGLAGSITGAVIGVALTETSGIFGIVAALGGACLGGALGLGAGLAVGAGVAVVREALTAN